MRERPWSLALLALLATPACVSTTVHDPVVAQRPAQMGREATWLVDVSAGDKTFLPTGLESAVVRRVREAREGAATLELDSVAPQTVQGPALRVAFRVEEYAPKRESLPGGAIAIYVTGSLFIIPWAFIGLVSRDIDHYLRFEAVLTDLRGVPIVNVPGPDGARSQYDVRAVPPTFRASYELEVRSSRNFVLSAMGDGDEKQEYQELINDEITARMLNRALPDLERAAAAVLSQPAPR